MTVNPTRTVPSLQGTCHKHTSKRYKPNLWQEPFSPSRPNASQRDSAANLTDTELINKICQCLTSGHTP